MSDRAAEGAAREAAYDRGQQRDLRGVQLAKGAQELEAAEATADQKRQMNDLLATPGVLDPDGLISIPRGQEIARSKGYTDILPDFLTLAQENNAHIEQGGRERILFEQGQTDRRQATNQQGVQRMIGESIAARGGEPITSADRQMYQGMALQEGVTLPAGVLPEEKPFTYGALQNLMVNGKRTPVRTRSDGVVVDLRGNVIEDAQSDVGPPQQAGRQSLTPNMEANVIRQLAAQWTAASQPARDLERQVSLMDAGIKAAERGDLAQGSQAVLVTFQKLLDPTSVVRESEYARSAAGLALTSRARGAYERLAQGGAGVPLPELRKFADLAREMADAQRSSYLTNTKERLGKTADRYSIPRELVFEAEPVAATDQPPGGGEFDFDPATGQLVPRR